MRALSIRQPFIELILQGIKTIEYRSRPTRIIGERFYLYAAKQWAMGIERGDEREEPIGKLNPGRAQAFSLGLSSASITSDNLSAAAPPPWIIELATAVRLFGARGERLAGGLATGVIVGTAVIEKVTPRDDGLWQWHLVGVERARRLRKPRGRPQPVWFLEDGANVQRK